MASTIKVDNVQNQPGTNIVSKCGTDVTLGASGDTVALACGASQTGFGRTGTVDWVTTPKVTGDSPITAATGSGYFLNTTAGTITINLPAGAAGSIVSMADYAATWQTYNVTVAANGSEKIGGVAEDAVLSTEGQSVTFVYVDSTQGWINTMDSTSNVRGDPGFMVATGGTITTSGNDKIHKFTGPGTFAVTSAAVCATNNLVSYMVVGGGGSGGNAQCGTNGNAGGAGAGGFRELVSPTAPYTASPLDGYPTPGNRITVSATPYAITVGAGAPAQTSCAAGSQGSTSTFSSISSAGGGAGGNCLGGAGGSGGGAANTNAPGVGGAGNTPPTTPPQGNNGGTVDSPATSNSVSGGGGGAGAVGQDGQPGGPAGNGGAGVTSHITASPVGYAGGGGGGGNSGQTGGGSAGSGGGGAGGTYGGPVCGVDGGCNTGGGGGATASNCSSPATGGAGGSGIVVIRYRYQ